ncbi:MAG TPA: NYN domain-containing protein, partial [Alloiococcus sp.]|nr:NYN domain-containing protein [Alloiococcus sp.]
MKNSILYVDGYNMIGAWPNLKPLQQRNQIGDARDLLLDMLSNYSKFTGIKV